MSVNENLDIVFKAGNLSEVAQSLANYCQVPIEGINETSILDIYNKYDAPPYLGIAAALWEKFNPLTRRKTPSNFKAFRYHKTGSNGQEEWFLNGLQTKDNGIKNFISNLNYFYGIDLSCYEKELAAKCIEKNEIDDDDGPYAFIYYKYAKEHSGFVMPEVFSDFKCDKLCQKVEQAKQLLFPTIVVFWYQPSIEMLDRYIKSYCSIIIDDGAYEYASFAINQAIPFKNIECIKTIEAPPLFENINNSNLFSLTMIDRQ